MRISGIILAAVFLCAGCVKKDKERFLPDSVGPINSLIVVIDNDLWKGPVGDKIREYYAAPVVGLPWDEPSFSIKQMAPEGFNEFWHNYRNIMVVQTDSANIAGIQKNKYAFPQQLIYVKGADADEIMELLNQYSPSIIDRVTQRELEENQRRIKISLNKETDLQDLFGISLKMPSIYKVAKREKDFVWVERRIQKGTMNILAYTLPLNEIPTDSTQLERLIKIRDSIGFAHVPGPVDGSYMITEKAFAPYLSESSLGGKPATQVKGMWEVKNFFMAGPFLNYVIRDEKNDRILVLEGFTFAPSVNKRNFMFELEAILQSIKYNVAPSNN